MILLFGNKRKRNVFFFKFITKLSKCRCVPAIFRMIDLQRKFSTLRCLFSYNNYKEPLNSRSEAAISKLVWIIHDQQDADESQGETEFGASDVRFVIGVFDKHLERKVGYNTWGKFLLLCMPVLEVSLILHVLLQFRGDG